MIGKTIGNYKIDICIGEGSMGMVYLTHHLCMKRLVAITTLLPHLLRQEKDYIHK